MVKTGGEESCILMYRSKTVVIPLANKQGNKIQIYLLCKNILLQMSYMFRPNVW